MRYKGAVFAGVCLLLCLCGCGKADKYYERGLQYAENQEFTEALVYFDKALSENENKAEYYISRGFAYCELSEPDLAEKDFNRVIFESKLPLVNQNNKKARRGLGILYYKQKNYEKAREYLELALSEKELPELNQDILMYLADTYECKQDYTSAIKAYDEILEARPDYADGYRARAYMEYLLTDYTKSLEDYNKAISLDSANLSLYFGKYNVLEKLSKKEEQKALLQMIMNREDRTAEDDYYIAKAEFFCGDYKNAEELLKKTEGYPDTDYYLGEIYREQSDFEEALFHYTEFLTSAGSEDPAAYNQAAVCLINLERYEEAYQMILSGEKYADSSNRELLAMNEIVILEKLSRYNDAYNRAVIHHREFPDNVEITKELKFLSTRVRDTDE